jgi:cytochrome P450
MIAVISSANNFDEGENMADDFFQFPMPGKPILEGYERLRDAGPVVPIELPGGVRAWAVTNHATVADVLARDHKVFSRDPRHWSDLRDGAVPADWPMLQLVSVDRQDVQVKDGADHRRLRSLMARAFTAARVEALTPRIRETTDALLDEVAAAGDGVDLVSALTEPLPMSVICDLYGVPDADRPQVRACAGALFAQTSTAEDMMAANAGLGELLAELVARKRREPGDDLTTGLIRAQEDDRLTDDELVGALWIMLLAGHETTVHMLGHAIVLLCTHPDQQALAIKEDLWPQVVEETLRFRTSVLSSLFRFTMSDTTIAGVHIPAGQAVFMGYGGAGTDPEHYGDTADRFDITRERTDHLSFGYGPHFCIGALLARLEGRIALAGLFHRFPELTLAISADEVPYTPSFLTYGPLSLPVDLGLAGERTAEHVTPEPAL